MTNKNGLSRDLPGAGNKHYELLMHRNELKYIVKNQRFSRALIKLLERLGSAGLTH